MVMTLGCTPKRFQKSANAKPIGRVKCTSSHSSVSSDLKDAKWYADKDFAENLHEDIKIRDYLKQSLQAAGVSRIETERSKNRLKITIHTAKPGMVMGRGGSGIEQIKEGLKGYTQKRVDINIAEIKQPDMDATLVRSEQP